ncbi:uncharacterized protein LOC111039738 [Myzus persicae]|uniref:uncharacterized protein LOC111039738 n=1 Tax=Myzus persicae TaxID=13164 RepID=UPI000B933E48|nr:uncharacterized protein LOC111039738 [Myzus persicae]
MRISERPIDYRFLFNKKIMLNISAAKSSKKKLLSNVIHSILICGSPVWTQDMSKMGWSALLKIQRRICLRVASAYCTVSSDAVCVISGIVPLDLMAYEREINNERRGNPRRRKAAANKSAEDIVSIS